MGNHRVGIVGFRGYSGAGLLRILDRHPSVTAVLLEHRQEHEHRPQPIEQRQHDRLAEEDCELISELLTADGLSPVILDDSTPGIPEGAYEVRVPADQAERAERVIAEHPLPDEVEEIDPSPYLDLSEPIFHSEGSTTAEFEATEIKNLLESNNIAAVIVGDSVLPNFPFEVRVAVENADRARKLIEDYTEGGPEAAEQAERETE